MSARVMEKYIAEGIRALELLEDSGRRGGSISMETLMRLIRANEDTEYGKKYHFRDIRSYADYAGMVPFSVYEDYEPYIERMLCLGQKNLITADEIVYYAHTSGTSGASKMDSLYAERPGYSVHHGVSARVRPLRAVLQEQGRNRYAGLQRN